MNYMIDWSVIFAGWIESSKNIMRKLSYKQARKSSQLDGCHAHDDCVHTLQFYAKRAMPFIS